MADERNRWLDEAAADELLRGEPVEPVGPGADRAARGDAARLRAALDTLEALAEPPPPGAELPGEAAAVAAFRAAHGATPVSGPDARPGPRPTAAGTGEPLLDLGALVPAPRRRRTVRFGLAAAVASVAVGGLAAAAATGLLDRSGHGHAAPAPALSVSADGDPAPGDTAGPPSPRNSVRNRCAAATARRPPRARRRPWARTGSRRAEPEHPVSPRPARPPAAACSRTARERRGATPRAGRATRTARASGPTGSRPRPCARTTGRAASTTTAASGSRAWPAASRASRATASPCWTGWTRPAGTRAAGATPRTRRAGAAPGVAAASVTATAAR